MCLECGCGNNAELARPGAAESAGSTGSHTHGHGHEHDHSHDHAAGPATETDAPHRTVQVQEAILAKNDRLAERNRGYFQAKNLLVLNVLSSPGSGKTALIQRTITELGDRLRTGVIVGDLATENDANRLRSSGAPVVQITTGTVCHLEADMVARAMNQLDLDAIDLLIIENVGNLVCPADFDLGEDLRVVLLSVTEGEDKPLKYPPMFHAAQVVVLTKMDLADAVEFNRETTLGNVQRISHHARVFEVSAKQGQGMNSWCDFLIEHHRQKFAKQPAS